MSEDVRAVVLGTLPLSVMLAVAVVLTVSRPIRRGDPVALGRVLRLFLLGIPLQLGHFLEELTTGFHDALPRVLGLAPWTRESFAVFNLSWIVIWLLSAVALRRALRVALVPVWFFAIGMSFNGVAHPALALLAGGYFPGLVTSPLVGIVGVVLCVRLSRLTDGEPGREAARRAGGANGTSGSC